MTELELRRMVEHMVAREHPDTVRLRRLLHRHPELSHRETRTADRVERELAAIGLATVRPTATSVLASLSTGQSGPVTVLRADMDALPIQEATGLDFCSVNDGIMHACGHDGHMAVLVSVARIAHSLRDRLAGEVRFLFQHAEESLPSGAPEIIECGVLDDADVIIGHHLWAPLPTGHIAVPRGPLMASTDYFDIAVTGRGGHAGLPHQTTDPVVIGAQITTNLQHVVSRETDPMQRLVVAVTGFHAGEHHAIVPETAILHGTVRALDENVRRRAAARIERIAGGIAAAHDAEARSTFRFGPATLINDAARTDVVRRAAIRQVGAESLVDTIEPVMAGEDFACYLEKLPGVFFLVGAAKRVGQTHPHHHPRFDMDENAMAVATRVFVDVVLELCGSTQG